MWGYSDGVVEVLEVMVVFAEVLGVVLDAVMVVAETWKKLRAPLAEVFEICGNEEFKMTTNQDETELFLLFSEFPHY